MFSPHYQPALTAFPSDYHAARAAFLQALEWQVCALQHEPILYPALDPQANVLYTDVVWLGNPHAENVLILISATHGIEGFAGSAIQTDVLRQLAHQTLPANMSLALIHALNPWGFAWQRRVNEKGVDLNRNSVDFLKSLPVNQDYDLLKPDYSAPDATWSDARWRQAVAAGQYTDSTGLFYGGSAPSFSRRLVEDLIQHWRIADKQVLVLDLHTGLGAFGHGELICDHPANSLASRQAKQCFGGLVTVPALGDSCSVPLVGLMDYLWHDAMREDGMFLTLEYGTYPFQALINALRAEHLLYKYHTQPDFNDPQVATIRQNLREIFNPASALWQECVLLRARQVIRLAWQHLQGQAL
jgi:hypothetical protein